MWTVEVAGDPVPQGSMVRSRWGVRSANSSQLRPWRDLVAWHARQATAGRMILGPCELDVSFLFRRPKGHYRSGSRAGELRDSAPGHKSTAPDLDKLVRAVCDALTVAGAVRDDSQIALLRASKSWASAGEPGCVIMLRELP
jgi:Holliday junction resolvase RusA-like endonuclease